MAYFILLILFLWMATGILSNIINIYKFFSKEDEEEVKNVKNKLVE